MTDKTREEPDSVYLERCDPALNMARFYELSVQPSLFGGSILVRRWGRIGTPGVEKQEFFETFSDALTEQARIASRKATRGYRG